jgi:probable HAF family extracellular repeat protein
MRMTVLHGLSAAVLAAIAGSALAQPATFRGLGALPASDNSAATAVSADGATVVGRSGTLAFVWTAASGLTPLPLLPGYTSQAVALGVSGDGSTVVGVGSGVGSTDRAFKWTPAGGIVDLGSAGGVVNSQATCIAADGGLIGGAVFEPLFTPSAPAIWTPGGPATPLAPLRDGLLRTVLGASFDGSVLCGVETDQTGFTYSAFRWRASDGFSLIGAATGFTDSVANAISGDGVHLAGYLGSSLGDRQAFRWTDVEGVVPLGYLSNIEFSDAAGITNSGTIVVGSAAAADGNPDAFIWTGAGGMQALKDYLIANGAVGLTGWRLQYANAITPDGLTIVGRGRNPAGVREAWIATIPPLTPPCAGDYNADGFVDFFDANDFVACFEGEFCLPGKDADFNGDGFVDFFDFNDFVDAFETGC